jgi:predicted small metal-binding protein
MAEHHPQEYRERAMRLADELIELLQDHERREHGGERCADETINVIAYLGHRAGLHIVGKIPEDNVRKLLNRIRDYGAIHMEHT